MKIYVVCRECDDPFYPGHIAGQNLALSSEEEAKAWCHRHNVPDDDDFYYYETVELT